MDKNFMKKTPMSAKERGEVIKAKYREMGMEQKELAARIGIDHKKLNDYITGKIKTMPLAVEEAICSILNLDKESDFYKWELPALSCKDYDSEIVLRFASLLEFVKKTPCDFDPNGYDIDARYDILAAKMSNLVRDYLEKEKSKEKRVI